MEAKAPFADCETCPLRDQPFVAGSGVDNPRIVIVGEAPGAQEVKTGVPFIGKSGQLLNKVLEFHGIDRRTETYITNTVLCRPPLKDGKNTPPTAEAIKHCKKRLVEEIKGKAPQAVLALGSPASKALLGSTDGITKLRVGGAKPAESLDGIPVVATFHPAAILRDPSKMPSLTSDVGKLRLDIALGWEPTKIDVYDDVSIAIQQLQEQVTHPENGLVSLDIENAPPFDRHDPHLLSIAVSHQEGHAAVYTKRVVDSLHFRRALDKAFELSEAEWWFQGGTYDIQYLWGVGVPNARVDGDTLLAHYATDERKGTHDLQQLGTEFLNAPRWKDEALASEEEAKAKHVDLAPEVLHQYNGTDADVTLRLAPLFKENMISDGVQHVYDNLLIPGTNALSRMEYRGFNVDTDMLDDLEERLTHELSGRERELQKWVVNPRSPIQLKKAFAEIGSSLFDTTAFTLQRITETQRGSEQAEFAQKMLDYRHDHKTLTTYVRGMRKRMIRGKVYSRFLLHGTETGRLSSRNPNLQNITAGELRSMFTASAAGRSLLTADYSAIELRVAALEIESEWLLNAFREDRPIHKEVAASLFGANYTPKQYTMGKTVTFGIFYDRRAPAIAAALRISVSKAQRMIDDWKKRCPELDVYFQRIRDEIHANSYLRSKFGRLRRFWMLTQDNALDAYREGYNFPIQSAAGDINLTSLIRLDKDGIVTPVVTVHDNIVFDVWEAELHEAKKYIRSVMEDTPDFDIPTPVEFKEGYRWS